MTSEAPGRAEPTETPDGGSADRGGSANDPMPAWRWSLVLAVAILILLVFVFFAWWMVDHSDDSVKEEVWNRRLIVFSAVEAIAFTAIGWVFGREVHRSEVNTAKQQGEAAKQDAAAAKQDADKARVDAGEKAVAAATEQAKGEALALAVKTSAASAPGVPEHMRAELVGITGASLGAQESQLTSLQELAARLYPDA